MNTKLLIATSSSSVLNMKRYYFILAKWVCSHFVDEESFPVNFLVTFSTYLLLLQAKEIAATLMLHFIHNIHLTMPGVISYLEGPKPLNGREWMLTGHLAFFDSSIFPAPSSNNQFTFQSMTGRHFTLLCGY